MATKLEFDLWLTGASSTRLTSIWSSNEEKLAAHGVEAFEVVEVLSNGFQPVRDKGREDRYRLLGRTDAGRPLELVVVVVGRQTLRFITGWPL